MSTGASLRGVQPCKTRLKRVSEGAAYRKVITKSLRVGIGIVSRAQKAAVPQGLKDVRAALGSRVLKKQFGNKAKAGAGVGKQAVGTRAGKRGVGISKRNIHWYVMGTKARSTGSKRIRAKSAMGQRVATGGWVHSTGRMPSHGFIRQAGEAAASAARVVMRQELHEGLRALWNGGG